LAAQWDSGVAARRRLLENLARNGVVRLSESANPEHLAAATLTEIVGGYISERKNHMDEAKLRLGVVEKEREGLNLTAALQRAERFKERDRLTSEVLKLSDGKAEYESLEKRLRLANEAKLIAVREEQWQSVKSRLAAHIKQQEGEQAREKDAQLQAKAADGERQKNQSRQKRLEELAGELVLCRQTAILAKTLTEGTPCPVCGSVHHPSPAKGNGDESVGAIESEQRRLREQSERADKAFSVADATLKGIEARIAQLADTIKEERGEVGEKKAIVIEVMNASGFKERSAYEAALADLARAENLQKQSADYLRRTTELSARLAAVTAELGDSAAPDVVGIKARYDSLTARRQELLDEVMKLSANLELCQNQWQQLQAELKAGEGIEGELALLTELSAVAAGSNAKAVSFETYILTNYFEDIIKVSNNHLSGMTGGRYELRRMEDRAASGAYSGLDLEVTDHADGATRAISTLSGGEGFKASLALALGLADVVRIYSGAI
ncbi:MAG: hypothetical protein RR049_06080, partial [Angelakisella sp.]